MGDNAIDKAAASGRWADEDYMRAGKALSDKVMFTFDPSELPPGWRARSNDPIADSALAAARVATLLKSFMFKTGVILKDRLWTEAKKGNFRPWLPFLAFYPAAGEVMRQLGGALTFNSKQIDWWQDPNNQDAAKILERTAEDIGYATGLTSLMWLVQSSAGTEGLGNRRVSGRPVLQRRDAHAVQVPFGVGSGEVRLLRTQRDYAVDDADRSGLAVASSRLRGSDRVGCRGGKEKGAEGSRTSSRADSSRTQVREREAAVSGSRLILQSFLTTNP